MTILLFPGRHLLNTAFQADYLGRVLHKPLAELPWFEGIPPTATEPIDHILFAITSSNHEHSRYSPIPFHIRAIGVDRFARTLELAHGITYSLYGIPHYPPTPRFGEIILKEIEEQSEGNVILTPQNCVVLSSTPDVMAMYRELGFAILPAELGAAGPPPTPIEVLQQIVAAGDAWASVPQIQQALAPTALDLWQDFPDLPRRIFRLWRDPLLNDEGSLTDTRNYTSYAYGMGNQQIIQVKYQDIKHAILPGKIVDEGCADGSLLEAIAQDFPDSDLIGIEITGEFIARARERQRAGAFGGTFVHFHQRNITQPIFQPNSIQTTICNSTVHELWSYGKQAETVHAYFAEKFRQTARGGRLVIRDVVGPEDKEQIVWMHLADNDGSNQDPLRHFDDGDALAHHLSGLSTYSRFLRFAQDFLAERRATTPGLSPIAYSEQEHEGERYIILSLRNAVEFMTKKDYVDNWYSEMNEEFAFWSFSEWKAALQNAGFSLLENPNLPDYYSRAYTNPWLVENRFIGKVTLFTQRNGQLHPHPYPVTNVVLVAEKP